RKIVFECSKATMSLNIVIPWLQVTRIVIALYLVERYAQGDRERKDKPEERAFEYVCESVSFSRGVAFHYPHRQSLSYWFDLPQEEAASHGKFICVAHTFLTGH